MKTKSILWLSLVLGACLAWGLAAAEPGAKPSEKEKDGYTIFYMSLHNAEVSKTESIAVSGELGQRTIKYTNHVLSCGTWMNGEIKESSRDGKVYLSGSWKVSKNPFNIASLTIDLNHPADKYGWSGTMVVDGKTCVVEHSVITKVQ